MNNFTRLMIFVILLPVCFTVDAQTAHFTSAEYKKALWMTTRFYGGQRSGENNWLVANHLPPGVPESLRGKCFIEDKDTDGYDLSGGWHDCGDHVKFGQTEFYSGYMLLKGYAEFPAGYDDYYSYDYEGYKNGGDWSWEGNKHDPNGIPDILDEVKHATDYFIKCAKNSSTFYYQVGQGNPDHAKWVTAVKMQTLLKAEGGQTRTVYKNPADASMPSFCGATLALMSRVYRKFDPEYADLCLVHAKYAYDYAKAHPGVAGTGDGGFYTANDNWKDDYATMCAELFWATGTQAYKTEALSFSIAHSPGMGADAYGKNYGFDYTNNGDIAIYNLALLGKTNAKETLNSIVNNHYFGNTQADGQFAGGNAGWGPLRYNANTAFIVALWQKLYGTSGTPNKYIYDNIDYILGKNSANQSFVVGFGSKSPKFPHHRNVYLRDDNPDDAVKRSLPIPTKNQQFGLMVGGTRNPSTFSDDLVNYQHTEGGIDYNACLVGALAYINSVLAPVDTNKFGHPTPNLGPAQSICGLSGITLNSQITKDGVKTFTWYKDDVKVAGPNVNLNTYNATSAGTYKCVLDSAGLWETSATVEILGVLPDVDLGSDIDLCDPATATLDMEIAGSGITYSWSKNGTQISNATNKTLTIYYPGTYRGTISASGCPSKYDEIVVTSTLPNVTHDTICTAGTVNLTVSGTGGPFEWFENATMTSPIHTGPTYSTAISSSRTFYVKDASSLNATAGPNSTTHTLATPQNGGSIGVRFTAAKAFKITEMKVLPYVYGCDPGDMITVTFDLKQGATVLASYTSTGVACTGIQSGAPFNSFYTLTFSTPIDIPAAGDYELLPASGNQLVWFGSGANFSTMDAVGVMDITDDSRNDMPNSFPGIFDIKIQAGSSCTRMPVFAVIDSGYDDCRVLTNVSKTDVGSVITIFPNPSNGAFTITGIKNASVKVYDELGRLVLNLSSAQEADFGNSLYPGVYHAIIERDGEILKSINLIKH